MGCGSSAAPKAKYEAKVGDAPAAGTTAEATTAEPAAAEAKPAGGTVQPKKRPSLSKEVETTSFQHEGHSLSKDLEEVVSSMHRRPSSVQTNMEMVWMEKIPELYGVVDSDDLRDTLQEDEQSEKVQQCIASGGGEEVARILKEWLHDCTNTKGLEDFIQKAIKDVNTISRDVKEAKTVTLKSSSQDAVAAKPKLLRKGTGFVSAAKVRQAMANDFGDSGDEESEEEQDDEEFEAAVMRSSMSTQGSRKAVAAEHQDIPEDWKPPVYEKSEDRKKQLADALSESFMFAALSEDQLKPVIDAFQEVDVAPGDKVIEQGHEVGPTDRGLYVLESGELDVYKSGKEEAVFTYTERGQYFGDLALLYNAPRAATVIAKKACILWSIDRTTFNSLVKDAVQKAKERRMHFLESVDILKSLTADEVAKIGDALRERTYGSGVNIIQEGTEGDVFFILEKGSAAATKDGKTVMEYKPSMYFGELALLSDAPRAADVVTLEESTVLSLDRKAFQRLLGNLDNIMKERAATYDQAGA